MDWFCGGFLYCLHYIHILFCSLLKCLVAFRSHNWNCSAFDFATHLFHFQGLWVHLCKLKSGFNAIPTVQVCLRIDLRWLISYIHAHKIHRHTWSERLNQWFSKEKKKHKMLVKLDFFPLLFFSISIKILRNECKMPSISHSSLFIFFSSLVFSFSCY